MTQHDIFLSYSRTDTPMMQKVRDYLREQGFKVWTDEGIHAGTPSWKTAIEDAIREIRAVVVLFSPDSAQSKWVRAELDYAEAQNKPIFPLLVLGDASSAVPFGYTTYQWIDMRDASNHEAGLIMLAQSLRELMGEDDAPTARVSMSDVMKSIDQTTSSHPATQPAPSTTPYMPTDPSAPHEVASSTSQRAWLPMALGVLMIAVLALAFVIVNSNNAGEDDSFATEEALAQADPTEMADTGDLILPTIVFVDDDTLSEGWQRVRGNGYSIAVPDTWLTIDLEAMETVFAEASDMLGVQETPIDPLEADLLMGDWVRFFGIAVNVEEIGVSLPQDMLGIRLERSIEAMDVPVDGSLDETTVAGIPAAVKRGAFLNQEGEPQFIFGVYSWEDEGRLFTVSLLALPAYEDTAQETFDQIIQSYRSDTSPTPEAGLADEDIEATLIARPTAPVVADDTLPEGWQRIMGTGYSIGIPKDWASIDIETVTDVYRQVEELVGISDMPLDPLDSDLMVGDFVRFVGMGILVERIGVDMNMPLLATRIDSTIENMNVELTDPVAEERTLGDNQVVVRTGRFSLDEGTIGFHIGVYSWSIGGNIYTAFFTSMESPSSETYTLLDEIIASFRLEE
jgi:hypothetical protein